MSSVALVDRCARSFRLTDTGLADRGPDLSACNAQADLSLRLTDPAEQTARKTGTDDHVPALGESHARQKRHGSKTGTHLRANPRLLRPRKRVPAGCLSPFLNHAQKAQVFGRMFGHRATLSGTIARGEGGAGDSVRPAGQSAKALDFTREICDSALQTATVGGVAQQVEQRSFKP